MITITCTGVSVLDIAWNPGFPALFAVCLSSGAVFMMELTDTEIKTVATLPANLKASTSKKYSSTCIQFKTTCK